MRTLHARIARTEPRYYSRAVDIPTIVASGSVHGLNPWVDKYCRKLVLWFGQMSQSKISR